MMSHPVAADDRKTDEEAQDVRHDFLQTRRETIHRNADGDFHSYDQQGHGDCEDPIAEADDALKLGAVVASKIATLPCEFAPWMGHARLSDASAVDSKPRLGVEEVNRLLVDQQLRVCSFAYMSLRTQAGDECGRVR